MFHKCCYANSQKLPRSGLLIFDPTETLYVLPPTKPVNNKVFGGFASHQIMRKFTLRAVNLQLLLANI